MKIYTTVGSVRGCCGHKHRSASAAEKCLQRDHAGCGSQGGYSDRTVVESQADGFLYTESGVYYPHGPTSRAATVDDISTGRI